MADTPASATASSLDSPRAIAAQNRWRCSFRPAGGRPGDRIAGRPARTDRRLLLAPIATPLDRALRRPLESAQYTSFHYTQRLSELGITASVGSVADAYDNAMAESFVATLKAELLRGRPLGTRFDAELAVAQYLGWFNHDRLHSRPGDLPPARFEIDHAAETTMIEPLPAE